MKIAVCVSNVPDTATKIKIAAGGKEIDKTGVTFIVNPYDEFAIEEAVKTKEKFGGETVVISVGDDPNKEIMRKALAMGIDSGVLLKTSETLDSNGVATLLAEEIKSGDYDIVFMGKQSVDFDSSTTGQLTAQKAGFNCVSVCVSLEFDGNNITAEREIEGGREVVKTTLPAVITAQKGLNEPRYPNLKGIMEAKRKPLAEKPLSAPAPLVEVVELSLPPAKAAGKILGSDASAVPELVRLLREEAKVI
ncbi:MAG: electron transfer flavoprotein subunit beta/FixA family protein [Ignavibacteriales bacterium]|nr:MAG: electron transfer flavoprotein subunit beta/FixA family protein [Ignavibacteriaceae bacterium]MBW7874220.1 electron transfer flavoprotein subunit beta/FixA family protein [Ignavibacteria bacterium]MCZ2142308.1 electron transfer flavoprotein subunit beta/FixA family protein [Ignavibacteriales bacterium]OQY79568.1 MAG: electron transfer flavoprotein subunit beta [Ignavibacteriales bacterium UTCHB3]MBV6445192.1 Electron transfer flavoprotein subunit beta [Ignavibacteriaceae bacterium]